MIAARCSNSYFWAFIFMTIAWAIAMVSLFMIRRTPREP